MYKQRKPENILKAMIRGKIKFWLEVFQRIPHSQQRFVIRALNIRLYIGYTAAAQNIVNRVNPRFDALVGNSAVTARLIVKNKRRVFAPCAKLQQLGIFKRRAIFNKLFKIFLENLS